MSKDVSTIANTGFIIIRTTARRWVISFLKDWMDLRHRPGIFNDQLGFDCLYRQRGRADMGKRVMILPPHVLNSLQSPIRKQLPSHKVPYLALAIETTAITSYNLTSYNTTTTNRCSIWQQRALLCDRWCSDTLSAWHAPTTSTSTSHLTYLIILIILLIILLPNSVSLRPSCSRRP